MSITVDRDKSLSVSNDRGRAFEWCFVNELHKYFRKDKIDVIFTEKSKQANFRDSEYFKILNPSLKEKFCKGANAFIKWANNERWFDKATSISGKEARPRGAYSFLPAFPSLLFSELR